MKTKNLSTCLGVASREGSVLATIMSCLLSMLTGRVTAQTFTVLYNFTPTNGVAGTNGDGAHPRPLLILSGNTLYGTTQFGGSSGNATVFRVNTDGTGFTNLHSFTGGGDGSGPRAGLLLLGDTLYGTTCFGGSSGNGTVFAVKTDGTGFTNLHSFTATSAPDFTNSDGANPRSRLIVSGNTLYGLANFGGSSGAGTVFALNTDGTGFTNLHDFVFGSGDGTLPMWGGLTLSDNILYGTTRYGGSWDSGTVFALNTDGTGFRTVHSFTYTGSSTTNSDGAEPFGGVILSGDTLYGTTFAGGIYGSGNVFALNTNGTGFRILYNFSEAAPDPGPYTNTDGAFPLAGLTLSGNTLYGAAAYGGISGNGTLFAVNADGTGFANLHDFTATNGVTGTNDDGAIPFGSLLLSGNTLYGTAFNGGSSGNGTVFSLSLPTPQLTITPSGVPPSGIILTWPTSSGAFDFTGYTLQSATNLGSSAIWTTNSPLPVVVNGQNTVTNPFSGTQRYYRLSQ